MKRQRQDLDDIVARLSRVDSAWRDELAQRVIDQLRRLAERNRYSIADVAALLDADFKAGLTTVRLFLDLSKDELERELRTVLGKGGIGVLRYRNDPQAYLDALASLGITARMAGVVHRPTSWQDVLVERLKSGRGSAIKGQRRGRFIEDFTEELVREVFGSAFDLRCRFLGEGGSSTEKIDFAIPSKEEPRILIEVKAYGATGSKQTDTLGDVSRILDQKRHDTTFLLVLDGISWIARMNDLRNLVKQQNLGRISRIYTMAMREELLADLRQLRLEHGL